MSIKDKIVQAKESIWVAEGLTEEEIEEIIRSAKLEIIGFQYIEDADLTLIQQAELNKDIKRVRVYE